MRQNPASNIDPAAGGGPWTVDPADKVGDLGAGEAVSYSLRSLEFRGRKGYFKPWLPLDSVQITNKSTDSAAVVTINGQYVVEVPPNSVRGYSDTGIMTILVQNDGSTAITAGNLKIELSAERYDADEAAYDDYRENPLMKLGKGLIGL